MNLFKKFYQFLKTIKKNWLRSLLKVLLIYCGKIIKFQSFAVAPLIYKIS